MTTYPRHPTVGTILAFPLLLSFLIPLPTTAQEAERVQVPVIPPEVPEHRQKQIEAAAPEKPQVAPKQPRRVLIWDTPFMDESPHKGYCIPFGTYAMQVLGVKTGAFEPVVSDDVAMFLPENLKQFDAIVMNNSNGQWIRPTEADMERLREHGADQDAVEQLLRQSFMDWVSNGAGVVAYHHAIAGNSHWPEFQELLGATYWGHPWNEEVGVKVEEPDTPLLAAFNGKDFRLAEEIFQFNEPYSREKLRVLLSLDVENTNMGVQWIHRTDNDFALAWVRPYGKGRVFYTAFGHHTEIYWNPTLLRFYLDGIQFATGDLEAPMEPR
jgi:type 1 glutamine amidotransferase